MAIPPNADVAQTIIDAGRQPRVKEVQLASGTVFAHGLKRTQAKAWYLQNRDEAGEAGDPLYADERLIVLCIRDAAGKAIFSDRHLPLLADMNEADIRPLIDACMEVNGFGAAREAIRKNSKATDSGGSGSDLPPTTV